MAVPAIHNILYSSTMNASSVVIVTHFYHNNCMVTTLYSSSMNVSNVIIVHCYHNNHVFKDGM